MKIRSYGKVDNATYDKVKESTSSEKTDLWSISTIARQLGKFFSIHAHNDDWRFGSNRLCVFVFL